ncbi:PAS domain S-box protein [Bacillus sp. FJAT-50079]|uniref:PAS domain-containing protein n=1 Tax=Bacillus sp. FJAT-50079 TaxID=2833577 RepID=UPI001BC9FFA3|nr:PAS domain S-box protein [Bacillus sp. FJAT-50079]MBS4210385.1 PAS domain S-box protein [Bacillus sp. FJAT-50079]
MGKLQNKERSALLDETLSWFAETSRDLLLVIDSNKRISYINTSLKEAIHYDLSEIQGMKCLDFIHKEDRKMTAEWISTFSNTTLFPSFTNRFRKKNGSYIQLLWHSGKVINNEWILAGTILEEDINNVLVNNIGMSNFFEMADEAGDICDLEGRVILLNQAFEHLYGWKRKEILGKKLPIIPEEFRHEFDDFSQKILDGTKILHHQTIRMKKDGSLFPVLLIVAPIFDGDGKIIAISAITKDLSELLKTKLMIEQQKIKIAEQERLLFDISENISDVICLFDSKQFKFLYISPSFESMWGTSVEAVYASPSVLKEKLYKEDLEKILDYFQSKKNVPIELEYKINDDFNVEERWIRTKITPIANENGHGYRYVTVSQDITEWKKQALLLKKQEKLGALGQLAAGIAHEIRNPLTTVKGFIQLRAQQQVDDRYNGIILQELEQIEAIVTEFLMLTKPQRNVKYVQHNVNELVDEVVRMMKREAILHKIEIDTLLEDILLPVQCEPKQIKQVIINMLKNAIEAMPYGGTVYITTTLMSDHSVSIVIKDEGAGIPKEILSRLGEPFYSNKERGTGLGLMVSFKIIENHGGHIHIESTEGKGTMITILLPSGQHTWN